MIAAIARKSTEQTGVSEERKVIATMPSSRVSAKYLLEGCLYAVEQAGLLLQDAVLLYDAGRASSAAVFALFAREEVGRYKKLRAMRARLLKDRNAVTVKDIEQACSRHEDKQRASGPEWTTFSGYGEGQVPSLVRTLADSARGSERYAQALSQLRQIAERKSRRGPHQRHETRQRALYVGPSSSGYRWQRPCEFPKDEAFKVYADAFNVYFQVLEELNPVNGDRAQDPEFHDALDALPAKPCLFYPDIPRLDELPDLTPVVGSYVNWDSVRRGKQGEKQRSSSVSRTATAHPGIPRRRRRGRR